MRAFHTQLGDWGQRQDAEKASELAEREEVAYDPEDQTILAEAEVTIHGVPNRMCADKHGSGMGKPTGFATSISALSMAEKQKMTGELNKQVEGQKRQVQEQGAALS